MRAQHLLDAIKGSCTPVAQGLAHTFHFAVTIRESGCLAALNKKSGEIRPIAFGEVIRRLVSPICITAVKPRLQEVFLPYGQVGVGVRGGLEAASHTLNSYITINNSRVNLCCFKVDLWNALNECHREKFLPRLREKFPELFAWVQWCYSSPGELRFGKHRILSNAGAQQGDHFVQCYFPWYYFSF